MPSSSLSDTKSTEQLAKSNGSIASKESAWREIQTELRVRIGRDLMVDLIEIAKTVTRLKSIWHSPALWHVLQAYHSEYSIEYRTTAESLRKEKFLFLT